MKIEIANRRSDCWSKIGSDRRSDCWSKIDFSSNVLSVGKNFRRRLFWSN